MEILQNLQFGLMTAMSWENLLYCLAGVTVGMVVGVLPGIGHLAAISLLMPLTFHVPATASLIMLAGIYYGAQYGGSIASILLNVPGTASSAVVCLDGYPLAQRGRAGAALMITTAASFVGSCLSIAVLVFLAPPLAQMALSFHSADYFSMMVLGLVAAGSISQGKPLLGLASVLLGLIMGLVGIDLNTGILRLTFGIPELFDGISIVIVAMALFGVVEVISSVGRIPGSASRKSRITWRSLLPTRAEWRDSVMPMLRGSLVGLGIGVLPGTGGGSMSSFMAYAVEKRVSSKPETFGQGNIAGISAPEAANNAAAQSAFIPTLTLGIPGDAIMALMLGALLIHGIAPGPRVVTENPELFWGLVMSFVLGNFLLLILNVPLIQVWVRILEIPYRILFPSIILLICTGVYSLNRSTVDVILVAGLSVTGILLIRLGFEAAPLLLGFILGPMLEENLRRSLMLSRGSFMIFLERPVSAIFLGLSALLLIWVIWGMVKPRPNTTQIE